MAAAVRGAAPALRGRRRPGRAGDRRGGAGAARGARHRRSSAGREINLFFGGVQAVARDPRDRRPQRRRRPAPRRGGGRCARDDRLRGRGTARRRSRARRAQARLELLEQLGGRRRAAGGAARGGRRRAAWPCCRSSARWPATAPATRAREVAEIVGHRPRAAARFSAALGVPYADPDEPVGDRGRPRGGAADEGDPRRRPAGGGVLQVARTIGMGTARIAEANRELVDPQPDPARRHRARRRPPLRRRRRAPAAAGRRRPSSTPSRPTCWSRSDAT